MRMSSTAVIGATGRVGFRISQILTSQGSHVVAVIRDPSSPNAAKLLALPSVSLVKGDVLNPESLQLALKGVDAVVDVHGLRPQRISKFSDLWAADPINDPNHPAAVLFRGTENVIAACQANGVRKIVRITGLAAGLSPWHWAALVFGALLSQTPHWNRRAEAAIRTSGLDYTIVRPGGLKDVAPAEEAGDSLLLGSEAWGQRQPPFTTGLSRDDAARLCVLALADPRLSRATLRVNRAPRSPLRGAAAGGAAARWEDLLDGVQPDPPGAPPPVDMRPPAAAAGLAAAAAAAAAAAVAARAVVGVGR